MPTTSIPKVITDFLERSFASSSSSQNKDDDLVGSEIALFAKYFPKNKEEKTDATSSNDNDDNEDYQFWTCLVSKSNDSSDKQKRDYFLTCSVGESAPVDLRMLTSARNQQQPQKNKNNNYDNSSRKTTVPPDDRIYVWLRSDYGSLYKIRPASKDECKDFETKIAGSYSSSSYGRVWRDRGLGVPTQLCKTGIHFGPTIREQDMLRSGQIREIEVTDEAARQGTAFFSRWTMESMASFSIFGMSVAEMQTKREQSAR